MRGRPFPIKTLARAPTSDEIAAIGERLLAALPEPLRRQVENVVIRVQDFPDAETLADMECESPFDLLGLYRGTPVGQRSELDAPPSDVDMIFLYRRPILDHWCETGDELEAIVGDTMLHEIGHHFGFSEDDLDRLGIG